MNENKLTPSIRFKNNDGENYPEWDFVKVKEIASINTGNKDTKDAVENGQYDFYVRSPIVHKIDSFIYDGEAVLTVGDGVGVGKVFHYVNGKFDFHQRVYKISDFKDYYGLLFYYYFQKKFLKEAQKYNAKTSVDSVRKSMIADMYVPKIEMSEQIKIGNFFSKLDRQIELEEQKLAKLEEQKKGYMQQIFSQQLRFKSENGNDYPEWKKEIIGNIATTFSGGTPSSTNSTFYTGEIPFIRSGEISKTSTELMINEKAISNSSAKMVETGDLLYALYGATSGEVAISKINGAINQAVLCIRSQESIAYIFNYLKMKKDQILKTYIQGGQGNLSASIIKKVDIDLPSLEEQKLIGHFFNKFDDYIEIQSDKVELLKERKKGFLQKMFV